jgi:2'-5' RNA ligase
MAMVYGIVVYFDHDEEIREIIGEIGKLNPYMVENNILPHLTLALFEAGDEEKVIQHFNSISVCSIEVNLRDINTFPGTKNVLFLDCELTEEMEKVQKRYSSIPGARYYDFYTPGNYHPHITLGIYLSDDELIAATQVARRYHFPKVIRSKAICLLRCDDFTNLVMKECN